MQAGLLRTSCPLLNAVGHLRSIRMIACLIVWSFACAAAGCGSTVATSTGPSPTKCGITLAPPASPVNSSGATATIAVRTQAECAWTASSEVNWITGLTPASGQGTGDLRIEVASNPDAATRQGDIVVNGERARIRQDAAPCRFELSPTEPQTFDGTGGNGRVDVTTLAGCSWTASSSASWIAIAGQTGGTGTGVVSFTIGRNTSVARTGTLTIAGQTISVSQASATCSYVVTPLSTSVVATGGAGTPIAVETVDGCTWTAVSNATWLTVASGASGSGDGAVGFTASANTGGARSGTLTIAGQIVTVAQAAANCSYTVTPTNVSVPSSGVMSSAVSVSASSGCPWTAASNVAWMSIVSGSSGAGNGTASFTATANTTGAIRTGTLTIAGQPVTITQASTSCSYSVKPTSLNVDAGGGAANPISIMTANGCPWTASSNTSWLSITSGATGLGDGTVTITAAANTGGARNGTVTVANQTVTVNQAAAPCTYTVSPTSTSIGAAGGSGTPVSVNTSSGCTWTARSNVNWVTIATGSSGTGAGTVTYSVQSNAGSARTGTLTVAGQMVTISQAACMFTIAPTSQSFDSSGGAGGPVAVTTQTGCAWTAVSNANWITVSSGASGTGNGAVTFNVAANTGGARTGTLTIAGLTFTVSQQKK